MYELHSDESAPEFIFQDYEHRELFERLGLIGESFLSPKIYEIAEQINESEYDSEVFSLQKYTALWFSIKNIFYLAFF